MFSGLISLLSTKNLPSLGDNKPKIKFIIVVFPEPVCPLMATLSPLRISILTLFKIYGEVLLYLKDRLSIQVKYDQEDKNTSLFILYK